MVVTKGHWKAVSQATLAASIVLASSCAVHRTVYVGQAYDMIEPLTPIVPNPGLLRVEVKGLRERMELYVNGIALLPDEPERAWTLGETVYELRLKPGTYRVEGKLRVELGLGYHREHRICTREDIAVEPDSRTILRAEVETDWRGLPVGDVTYFEQKIERPEQRTAPEPEREPA